MKKTILFCLTLALITPKSTYATSLFFDGVNDYLEIPDAPELSGYDRSLTVEAWILPTDQSYGEPFISKYLHWNTKDWGLLTNDEGLLGFQKESGPGPEGGNWYVYSSQPVLLNEWNHTAFVFDYDNDIVNLYLNGELAGSRTLTGYFPDTSAVVWVGGIGPFYYNYYGTGMFYGHIDDVRIWNVARTEEEILNNMLSGSITGYEAGLVRYWNFDEGSGQIAHDLTPFEGHGRLGSTLGIDVNDPTWSDLNSPVPIPEPSTLLLLGSASLFGAAFRRLDMLLRS